MSVKTTVDGAVAVGEEGENKVGGGGKGEEEGGGEGEMYGARVHEARMPQLHVYKRRTQ